MTKVTWFIDGIPVDGVLGQPTYARGESQTLEAVINDEFEEWDTGGIWGGDNGTLWGETNGGTWGDENLVGKETRYTELRKYLEYAGEGATYQLIGGAVMVHENQLSEWPVDSHIVPIEPGENIHYNPGMWALIVGGDDDSTIPSEDVPLRLNFEIIMLAKLNEYETRDELINDLSPVVVQYE